MNRINCADELISANDRELHEKEMKMMELQESYETKLLHHQVRLELSLFLILIPRDGL